MDQEELINLVEENIDQASSFVNSEVDADRETAYSYYLRRPYGNEVPGPFALNNMIDSYPSLSLNSSVLPGANVISPIELIPPSKILLTTSAISRCVAVLLSFLYIIVVH
jgi:hypothetical protein